MDNPELTDKYVDELCQLTTQMRHDKVREELIHFILEQAARDSETKIIAKGELG